jgi:hypothetical protein
MWDFASETVALNAGENTITYQYDQGDSGDVHLDAIIVAKVDDGLGAPVESEPTVTPVLTPAAEPTQIPSTPSDPLMPIVIGLIIVSLIVIAIVFWRAARRKPKKS